MKVFMGLGNPGEKYAYNRHNVGFMFADYFLEHTTGIKVYKPQTFMNRSGETVRKIMIADKSLRADDIYVAHDDLDIPIGKFKIQKGVGPKLHNGLESIEQCIGTKEFWRIRIGVENRPAENRIPGEAYVLQNFTEEERVIINQAFTEIYGRLKDMLK